jgi:imidazolonepropionase-like amidohydrolase
MSRFLAIALLLFSAGITAEARAGLAVRGALVHTMAGAPIRDGVVLIRDGKIERVGEASRIRIPEGYRLLEAAVVTPGLVDGRTAVGLAGYLNQPHDQDQVDHSSAVQPELRALDGYNPQERLVEWVRSFGVTTMNTGHAPVALVPGQMMIVKTIGSIVDESVIVPQSMVAVTLGNAGLGQSGKEPGTRPKSVAMLRSTLLKAQEYARKANAAEDKRPARDLGLEALLPVINREMPLLITAHRAHDILTALRLAGEFNVRMILDGAAEAYMVADQIRAAGVPVMLHPTMFRSVGETENLSMETASILTRKGIQVAIQSGYESYVPKTRVLLFEAAIAAANGLSAEEALATVTSNPAAILGIGDRVGSLEPGKDADLALFSGDPFEYTTHVTAVIVNGQIVSEQVR